MSANKVLLATIYNRKTIRNTVTKYSSFFKNILKELVNDLQFNSVNIKLENNAHITNFFINPDSCNYNESVGISFIYVPQYSKH